MNLLSTKEYKGRYWKTKIIRALMPYALICVIVILCDLLIEKQIELAVIFLTISFLYTALQIWKLSRRRKHYDIVVPKMKIKQPNERYSLALSSHEDMERTISIDPKDVEKCFGRIAFLRINGKAYPTEQMPERIIDHDISIIGRGLGCDIQISDQMVSRRHARLTRCNGKIYIEDLNSTNGTRVNGTFLFAGQKMELDKDSFVEIGFTVFRVFPPEKL